MSAVFGHTSGYELQLASHLIQGKTVAMENLTAQDFDWRLMRKDYAQLLSVKPDVLVLGSSHTIDIHAQSFPGQLAVNAAFADATYEEEAAVYWIYRQRGLMPARVIIPLDFYLLSPHSRSAGVSESLQSDYAEAADYLGLPHANALLDLFNLAHFQISFPIAAGLRRLDDDPQSYHVAPTPDGAPAGILPDGSLFLRPSDPALHAQRVADSIALRKTSWFTGFTELDRNQEQLLERLLALLARDHVQVLLYLPPTHPLFYRTYHTAAYPVVDAAQRYYEELAKRSGLSLLGSYDPAACGLEESDFEDADHLSDAGLARLLLAQRCYQER